MTVESDLTYWACATGSTAARAIGEIELNEQRRYFRS
jgi:hypothetical protein